ncbi:glycosyltransferase [bacterium SCSIO 12741]|nr:glycosyltransferase [bacterium SCSIO 12741]
MAKLSVIIVNYNVRHFLEQCLVSALKASRQVDTEIIVVDNHSLDGSVQMVENRFPEVRLIASKHNLGFSKGNNLGIAEAKGEYILLLNPDTLVEEDTFTRVVQFMDDHPDCGGLGVKMIDGKGRFLPESKRGLPTPPVAFFKMFGLARLFPKSKTFGQYHLSFLDPNEIHEVDVLSGAFMLLRKTVLDKIGLLDETFFMYGEDIDLSYRIQKAGYKNYYFPETKIIHYKGESTKKTSINYVFVFYRAMVIFASKHFSKNNARLFGALINLAIYFRASLTLLTNFIREGYLAILDGFVILLALFGVMQLHNHLTGIDTPDQLYQLFFPVYTLVWIIAILFGGGYDKPYQVKRFLLGTAAGTGVILILYSLLPESYRFSRAIIIGGSLSVFVLGTVLRYLLHLTGLWGFRLGAVKHKRIAIVGNKPEIQRVIDLLKRSSFQPDFVARVSPEPHNEDEFFVGHWGQLREVISIFNIDEVIFCAEDLSSSFIIEHMSQLDYKNLEFKIAPPESLFVIGSNSINTSGELYSLSSINSVTSSRNRRNKRMIDIFFSLSGLITLPLSILFVQRKMAFIGNLFGTLFGQKTWVGYDPAGKNIHELPTIRQGVISPSQSFEKANPDEAARLNAMYARDYRGYLDLVLILRNFRSLGN